MNYLSAKSLRSQGRWHTAVSILLALALGMLGSLLVGCAPPPGPSPTALPLSEVLYEQFHGQLQGPLHESPPAEDGQDCPCNLKELAARLEGLETRIDALETRAASITQTAPEVVVEFYTRSGCAPCEQWKAQEQPRFEAAGIRVKTIQATTGMTPRFRILAGKRELWHEGALRLELFQQLVSPKVTP
jgi:hypothetical protein